jgi:hypothetical protein
METKISPDIRKPFRGLTTIQLFDKNTGKLLEEYHDENTYNDRLQYISYLNSVLKCRSNNIQNQVAPFSVSLMDNADNEFQRIYATSRLGGSDSNHFVNQLFATLLLTNQTEAETAHGYFNGTPVGICDAFGTNSEYNNRSCTGTFNMKESYIGNDRLHLVFDFATDKCNVQFDALWLFPAVQKYASYPEYDAPDGAYLSTCPYQYAAITSEYVPFGFNASYTYYIHDAHINNGYGVVSYSSQSNNNVSYTDCIQVYNTYTGEQIAMYDFGENIATGAPFYYDAASNTLYFIQMYSTLGFLMDSRDALYSINLNDGTKTRVGYLYDLLGLTYAVLGYSSAQDGEANIVPLYLHNGAVYLLVRTYGKDATTLSDRYMYTFYSFDATNGTFTKLKMHQVYCDTKLNSSYIMSSYDFMNNGLLYTFAKTNQNAASHNFCTVFDIKTGQIKSDNMLYTTRDFLSNYRPYAISSAGSTAGSTAAVYPIQDLIRYREPLCFVSSQNHTTDARMVKQQYFTAVWSTHNKLTSAIKKTNMTTMKIQYDIIWDSIPEVIVPALI